MSDPKDSLVASKGATGLGTKLSLELAAEELVVERRVRTGQTVRVTTATRVREQAVEEELRRETVEVEHVPMGMFVERAPDVRQDGDVIVIPVMEEVLVVERRLFLKEEVRIRRVRTTQMHRESVQLREEVATVSRYDAADEAERTKEQPYNPLT